MKLIPEPVATTAAFLLGKVLLSFFPKAQLQSAQVWGPYFVYRFSLDHIVETEQLMPLQEAVYQEASRGKLLTQIEMIASNARELFKFRKQFELLELLPSHPSALVSLLRLEDHYDFCTPPFDPVFSGKFLLSKVVSKPISSTKHKMFHVEIWGAWAQDTTLLKKRKKELQELLKNFPMQKGKDLGYLDFCEDQGIFLQKGIQSIEFLKKLMTQKANEQGFESLVFYPYSKQNGLDFLAQRITPQRERAAFITWLSEGSEANSFLKNEFFEENNQKITLFSSCRKNALVKSCNYCLKFMLEIFKILGFSYKVYFCAQPEAVCWKESLDELKINYEEQSLKKGTHLRVDLEDSWGRMGEAFSFQVHKAKELYFIQVESLFSLEDMFFWMLQVQERKLEEFTH